MTNELNFFRDGADFNYEFCKAPKFIFKKEWSQKISDSARLLYIALILRLGLSHKNNWVDSTGRLFVYYTVEDVTRDFNCSTEKALKMFAQLDTKNGVGLIQRKRMGFGKPCKIYITKIDEDYTYQTDNKAEALPQPGTLCSKDGESREDSLYANAFCEDSPYQTDNKAEALPQPGTLCSKDSESCEGSLYANAFCEDSPYQTDVISENHNNEELIYEKPKLIVTENHNSETSENQSPLYRKIDNSDFGKTEPNKNNINNNKFNKTNIELKQPQLQQESLSQSWLLKKENLEIQIKNSISYDELCKKIPLSRLNEMVSVITSALMNDAPFTKIGGVKYPREEIENRFMCLEKEHIEYVYDTFQKSDFKLNNVGAYLRYLLFHSDESLSFWMDNISNRVD